MQLDRAYAVLEVKAFDAAARTITGVASTPRPDRVGDVLEPLGATFQNPVPLLLHHDKKLPVGSAVLTATRDAITFVATLAEVTEAGPLRDRIEEAWQSVRAKLIRGVSIGFRPLRDGARVLKSGGLHFTGTEICELSLVTIPQNVDATILTVKSADVPYLAAFGLIPSGAADALPMVRVKGAVSMAQQTTAEQITAFEATRATKDDRVKAIMQAAAETGATLDAAQSEEYDGLIGEIKSIDLHLERLKAYAATQPAAAVAVAGVPVVAGLPMVRPPAPVIQVRSQLPKGTGFVRMAMAIAYAKGDHFRALEYARQWDDSTPEVGLALKAAVAPGSTTDPVWAGALVPAVVNMTSEFIELLRPATIIGRIPGLRYVPFNAQVPTQTAGGAYGWVGQAKPKPVTKLGFSTVKLDISKAAGLIILTEELVKLSNPSAEAICKNDMIKGIAAFLDTQFIDPAVAAVAGVNPASITNGITPITAATPANPLTDVQKLLGALAAAGIPLGGVVLLMSETNALALGFARDAQGNKVFPNVGVNGGSVEGISVVTSNAVGTNIIALQPEYILIADDGGVSIDVSREASVQMDSAPDSPATATTVLVSLWQNNLVGLRAERFINWKRGLDAAVKFVSGANYTPAVAEVEVEAPNGGGGRHGKRDRE